MTSDSWSKEIGVDEFRKSLEPEYKQISKEIKPIITRILNPIDRRKSEILQLKENSVEYFERFKKAIMIGGKVSSLQKLQLTRKEPQLVSTLRLFQYLGLIESIGTAIVDMSVLLLVADGQHFHVERRHETPRIIHVRNFEDLDYPNTSLSEKIGFLKRNKLTIISKTIDTRLRNAIAHLNFDIDRKGKISTNYSKDLDIVEKINSFIKMYIGFLTILDDSGFVDFLNRAISERSQST